MYDGFISYSHAADGRLAPALQRGLQRLAKRWNSRRALHVFRDETGLSTNPHLWSAIETALDDSDWFVLLASPESAASEWVNKEVAHWVATKPVDHILPVVTDGVWEWDRNDQRLHCGFHGGAARLARRVARGGAPSRFALGARRDRSRSAQQPLPRRDRRSRGTDARHRQGRSRGRGHPPTETRPTARPRWHRRSSCSLLVVSLVFGALAVSQRNQANRQRDQANLATDTALTGGLASKAAELLKAEPG